MLKVLSVLALCGVVLGQGRPTRPTRPPMNNYCTESCPTGSACTFNRTNPACFAWRLHPTATPPAGCFSCQGFSDPCGGRCHRTDSPLTSQYCGLNLTSSNLQQCCSRTSGPSDCYGCFSRNNRPPNMTCTRPSPPTPPGPPNPIRTTRPRMPSCGELEVSDDETCEKFCSDPTKHEGSVESAKWTPPGSGGLPGCCCTDPSSGLQQCCIDRDRPGQTTPSSASCGSACLMKIFGLFQNTSFVTAITDQSHCDANAPVGSSEFEDCEAIERFVRSNLGSSFSNCCGCAKEYAARLGGGAAAVALQSLDCNLFSDDDF